MGEVGGHELSGSRSACSTGSSLVDGILWLTVQIGGSGQ